MKKVKLPLRLGITLLTCCLCLIFALSTYMAYTKDSKPASAGSGNKQTWGISKDKNGNRLANPGADELLEKYGGVYIGDKTRKVMYLTFDNGYEAGYTAKTLDVLKKNNIKSVFFITGYYINKNQELIKRMIDEGHYIGNHTMKHKDLTVMDSNSFYEEVEGLNNIYKDKFGDRMYFFRPPRGEYSEKMMKTIYDYGYTTMFWSFTYPDWDTKINNDSSRAYKNITGGFHNGAIILLHLTGSGNTDALESVIKSALDQGYQFGDPGEFKRKE